MFDKGQISSLAAGAVVACGAALPAMPTAAGDWDLSVALSSNYLVHGRTRSWNEPALQGHLGLTGDHYWSVGVWASSAKLHRGPGPHQEFDFYVAKDWQVARDWRLASQLTHYEFGGDSPFISYDYTKLAASVSFRDALSLAVALAPDYDAFSSQGVARDRRLLTWELSGHRPVTRHLRLTGGVGHADLQDLFGASYWYWSGGGELTWQHFSIGVTYVGADDTAERLFGPQQVGNTWVATVAYRIR